MAPCYAVAFARQSRGVYSRETNHRGGAGQLQTKAAIKELLDRLPDDCTLEDVQYHLYVLQAVEQGLAAAEAGRTMTHQEVEQKLREKWILGAGA